MVETHLTNMNDWSIIQVKARVDFSTQDELLSEIRNRMEAGVKKIALDLRTNRFLSLPAIKGCVDLANELNTKGGELALTFCAERTKRHFEIYGTLKHIRVMRYDRELFAS